MAFYYSIAAYVDTTALARDRVLERDAEANRNALLNESTSILKQLGYNPELIKCPENDFVDFAIRTDRELTKDALEILKKEVYKVHKFPNDPISIARIKSTNEEPEEICRYTEP